ncbi:hypothetical protein CLAIMM_04152 [Cladophialophora immunda]|nr:hypothetical protein CLAIMM_04152 [Cladophialophora immunda]
MSWGMRGGYFPVAIRAFMALMWLAILNISIGQCIHQMLRAIWPSFDDIPNALPASAGITSADLLCYFILLIIQTPLTLIPMYKLKWYFLLKAVLSPFVFIGMMIWALKVAPDGGPLVQQAAKLEGSAWDQNWTRVKAFGTAAGYFATITTNIPDFVRFARRPGNTWIQSLALPCTGILPVICSVITSSATVKIWNEAYWEPSGILARWENRGAVFIAAVVWIIATIGVNLSANTITVAIALSSFWPKYINNVRGSLIVAVLSVVICPWKIVYDAGSFYNFLSAYPSLLGPVSGILMADYWLVRRRAIDVRHLYVLRGGKFWFWHGVNWRAYAAFLCAYVPNMPGFISQVNPSIKNVQPYTYDLNWIFAVVVSVLAFWGLNVVFPPKYSLSGHAVHPDEVVDWSTRRRVGDWTDVPGFEDIIHGEPAISSEADEDEAPGKITSAVTPYTEDSGAKVVQGEKAV